MYTRYFLSILLFIVSQHAFSQTADFSITKREGCAPLDAVNFTDISTGGTVTSRTWDLGKGVINNNSVTVGNNYGNAGTFIITITVTFSTGEIRTKQDSIIVHPNPVAAFGTSDTAGCAPLLVQLKDLSTTATGTITDWLWNIGPGNSDKQNPSYLFSANGDYDVKLLVTNNWGCKSELVSKEKYIHVYDKVKAGFSIPLNYSCDTPFIVNFINSTTGGGQIAYTWFFGDGDSSKQANPVDTYIHPGVYTIQLTAKNGTNCTDTYTINNNLFAGKPIPSISATDSVCSNTPVTFAGNAAPASSTNAVTWKWVFPRGNVVFGRNVSYTFTTPGTYDVLLITYYTISCPDTAHHSIVVKQGPKPDFSADKSIGCSTPFTVTFSNLSEPSSGLKYDWNFGDGTSHSTLPSPSYAYNSEGSFTVTLTVTDTTISDGCTTVMQKVNLIRIAKPVVDFTYIPPEGCTPLPVNTTARVTNVIDPIVNYVWDFGDGSPITTLLPNATHVYSAAGSYYIKLKVVTQQGCTDSSKAKLVSVTSLCNDDGSGGGGSSGGGFTIQKTCSDKYTISFNDTVSNSIVISWDFGDGSPLNTYQPLKNPTHTFPNTAKIYIVTVTAKDTLTNQIYTSQKRIIIIDEKANFRPDIINICKDKKVNFTTIGIDSSNIDSYIWNFDDGTPSVTINNKSYFQNYGVYLNGNTSYSYKVAGNYNVKLTIKDKLGCTDSFSYTEPIVVKGPVAGFTTSVKASCSKNFAVDFTDTSKQNGLVPITSWTWDFGNGVQKTISVKDTVIQQLYTNSSYYQEFNVLLTVKDSIGCQSTTSQVIKSYHPTANFFSYDTLKCGNLSVTLYNNSSAYIPAYLWNFGDGTSATASNVYHTYLKEGFYDISLLVTDIIGCKDSITKTAFIKLIKPKADFRMGDTSKCGPVSIDFYDSSIYALKYKWDFGDKTAMPTNKDVSHLYNPGIYQVKLYIEGISGCTDSIIKTIRVKGPVGKLSTGNNIGCTPYIFSMKVNGTNISAYSWDYGDGTPVVRSQDSVVFHMYNSAAKVLPNVVMTSPEGCSVLLKADTIIVDSVKAAFTPDKTLFCDFGYVQFTDRCSTTSFSSLQNYKWDFGDNSSQTLSTPSLHQYTKPGTYRVSLAVESFYGCKDTVWKDAVIVKRSPSANIIIDPVICLVPASVLALNSTINSDDPVATYTWKIDNVSVSQDSNAVINYRIAGQHIVSLDIKTNAGCTASVNRNIIIDSVKASFAVDQNVFCGSGTVTFTNQSSNAYPVNYKWQFGDDSTSTKESPSHSYLLPGQYTVKLFSQTNVGCKDSFTLQKPVIINKLPVVNISGEAEKCAELLVHYDAAISSADSIQAYLWKLDSNTISKNISVDYFFSKAGSYNLAVTVTALNGCESTVTRNVIIHPLPVTRVTKDTAICIDDNIQLHASGGAKYKWSPITNLKNFDTPDPFANAVKSTKYYVLVTDSLGCNQKDSVQIIVDNKVSLQHSNDASICLGESIKLAVSGHATHFLWSPALGLSNPNIATPVASPLQTTLYNVVGYSDNACKNDTGFVNITVGKFPLVNLGPDLATDAGSTITLNATVSNDVIKYLWSPSVGLNCTNCSSPQFIADKDISYKLTVSTQYGCETSDDINIKVLCGKEAVYIPNAFTPNGDGLNDVFYIVGYGIQKIKSFNIYNRLGQLVYSQENILPNDKSKGWSGMFHGLPVAGSTTFVYTAEVICNEGKTIKMKGTVLLIR